MVTNTVKTLVEQALGAQRTKSLWTGNYYPALPFTPQYFDIGALMPAMLYMARFGHRRGRGNYVKTFAPATDGKQRPPSIADIAKGLQRHSDSAFEGFDDDIGNAVLGDLLLSWCLENRRHSEGHSEQVQRIYPAHYLASWIDLPTNVGHLRGVPELLVALLANQPDGEYLQPGDDGAFAVGSNYKDNHLLALFGHGMRIGQHASDLAGDSFAEQEAGDTGIDELLAIRLAQACKSAPLKASGRTGSDRIPNYHPIVAPAADYLREDLAVFIETYGQSVPRQAFLQMLEAGMALGLSNLLLSTARLVAEWEESGSVAAAQKQTPWPLFVDASQGQEQALRDQSETSMTECLRRYERLPTHMMLLRILDERVHKDRKLRDGLPPTLPNATELINLLGEIYKERHPRADAILDGLDEDCLLLADGLREAGEMPEIEQRLRNGQANPALRLTEALSELMGAKLQKTPYQAALDSTMMTDQPAGLASKRKVRRSSNGRQRTLYLRSIVLSSTLLDFLVHRHLSTMPANEALSLQDFLGLLRQRYGLYIDREPPGLALPQELLLSNKAWLERRLRDLGLLIGVNDAESMKRLRPRYQQQVADHVA